MEGFTVYIILETIFCTIAIFVLARTCIKQKNLITRLRVRLDDAESKLDAYPTAYTNFELRKINRKLQKRIKQLEEKKYSN